MPEMPKPRQVMAEFERRHGGGGRLYRAPGRVNLVGEHTDYNDGFVMPMNTAVFTWVAIRPRADRRVIAHSVLFDETVEFECGSTGHAGSGGWPAYLEGVVRVLSEEGYALSGADLLIDGNVPLGGGLSSSASLETALAVAFLDSAGHPIDPARVALMCQRAENEYVGVKCGIMDQFVIAGGACNHAMKLDCRTLRFEHVALPDNLGILVTDTGVKHQLGAGEYNRRREACESAVAVLAAADPSVRALRDATPELLDRQREALGDTLFRRARHVVTENLRVHAAERALGAGDLEALGRLIDASHDSLRDDYEVSCAELDYLVANARRSAGVYGSRMVGGGFGGCIITLADSGRLPHIRTTLSRAYEEFAGRAPWQHVVEPAPPAGRAEP
jgi:galactokinase